MALRRAATEAGTRPGHDRNTSGKAHIVIVHRADFRTCSVHGKSRLQQFQRRFRALRDRVLHLG
ncbi:hypothetical protein, partial [Nocardia cyriacigeorgica]|uniref:hypothetical protein n=1 Tax=Nocardia cyriacigeorgica TaxID=135487 RepID=UPI0024580A54